LPRAIAEYCRTHDLELWSFPSAEAQVGAIADDIAYDAHDIEDGLRAEMFQLSDIEALPLVGEILADTRKAHPGIELARLVHELMRGLLTRMIEDVVAESRRRMEEFGARSADEVRHAGRPLVGFSPAMAKADQAIKGFLYPRLYRHERIMRIMGEAEGVVRNVFRHYVDRPADLPPGWLAGLDAPDTAGRARRIADFIAGMTDRYVMIEHARLFGGTPELR
jgi:dGTPase